MSIAYRRATVADGSALAAVGRQVFAETFGPSFPEADMAKHLDRSFGPDGLLADLVDPACRVQVAEDGGKIVGYLKLMPMDLPIDHPPGSLEIKQLYILEPWQGVGVAAALMDWAIRTAREDGAPALFLSVWARGDRAIAFYRKHGFEIVGEASFTLGDLVMLDPVMGRTL